MSPGAYHSTIEEVQRIMDKIIQLISNNIAFFSSIVGTIVGGLITFISTNRLEKERERRSSQREKLDKILIPYAEAIEDAIAEIESIDKVSYERDTDHFMEVLSEPTEYLKAGKRVFLQKEQIHALKHYEMIRNEFCRQWREDITYAEDEYRRFVNKKAKGFPDVEYNTLYTEVHFSKGAFSNLFWDLISSDKRCHSMLDQIRKVEFIHCEDDPAGREATTIRLDESARSLKAGLQADVYFPEDILGTEKELPVRFLEYVDELDDRGVIKKITAVQTSRDKLYLVAAELKSLDKVAIEQIDKITK